MKFKQISENTKGGVERMSLVQIKVRGQLTLPSKIRKALNLEIGDYLEAFVQDDAVILKPQKIIDRERNRLFELIDKGRKYNRGVDPKEIEADIAEAVQAAKQEELKELRAKQQL
ncbi:AbrB/MazE/SpoVT family DNA-binding domain-containing protein [Candidatus Poribacteria bacterium]|nr:AbrB/MazE/SpoVT family DNA-binding domain-containing protein [Candidatus Poribacteria bacterium]